MKTAWRDIGCAVVLALAFLTSPAAAFDASVTFSKGTLVISAEGGYGQQFNVEGVRVQSDIEFWNLGLRAGLLPFGPTGPGMIDPSTTRSPG